MKAKILIVSPMPPIPPRSGAQMRLFQFLAFLKDSFQLHFCALSAEPMTGECMAQLDAWGVAASTVIHRPSGTRWSILARQPRCVAAYDNREMHRLLKKLAVHWEPAIIQYEFLWMAQYAGHRGAARTVLVEHDAEHVGMARFAARMQGIRRIAGRLEAVKTLRYERRMLSRFDTVVALTGTDADRLGRLVPGQRIEVIGQGVDLEHFRPDPGDEPCEGLVFIGDLRHFPNRDAMRIFCQEYLPKIQQRVGVVAFHIVGRDPGEDVLRLRELPGVTVHADVTDVAPFLKNARAFVCPMFCGGGMRGKLLEAMAAGTPVITNRMCCEGVPLVDGRHALVAETPDEFAHAVERLFSNRSFAAAVALQARRLVESAFAWETQAELQARIYERLLSGRNLE
ncbi:glycosyltransferase [bacterium]|nr:glycosyltransferase [candidate division CSSED10-310 bacterium]